VTAPLVAAPVDSTSGITGLGLIEDVDLMVTGIQNGSWVDATLSGAGASLDTLTLALDPIGTLAAWGLAWLMEHIRPLQESLDWLAGNTDDVNAQAATWANIAAYTTTAGQDYAERLHTEIPTWSGASADAYHRHANEHLLVLQGISTAAGGISSAVEGAGLLVALTRTLVRDLIAQFIATLAIRLPQWLAMEGLTLGIATPLVASQVATLVAQWVNKIQHFLRALLNSLRQLLPKIDDLTKILNRLRMLTDRLGRSNPTGRPGAARSSGQSATTPSSPPGPGRHPRGERTEAHPTRGTDRGLRRENETADVLARHGYDVEQNPPGKPNRKNPDYKIEGEYFDCYAPRTDNIDNIRKRLSKKVAEEQAERLVINLEDTSCTMDEIADMLDRKPIRNLKEILVVSDNQVVPLHLPAA
jgi:hypothetical protein